MASISQAILTSAQERVKDTVKDAKQHVMNQFDPRKSIYGLGLGIGPMIRETINAYHNQQKREGTGKDNAVVKSADKNAKKVVNSVDGASKKLNSNLSKLSTNIDGMNRILIKMHHQQMLQLGELEFIRERAKGGRGTAGGDDTEPRTLKEKASSVLDSDIGTFFKMMAGGLIAKNIWDGLGEDKKEITKGLAGAIGDMWMKAFESDALITTVSTAAAIMFTKAYKPLVWGYKGMKGAYNLGKGLTNAAYADEAATAATKAAQGPAGSMAGGKPRGPEAAGFGNRVRRIFGREQKIAGVPLSEQAANFKDRVFRGDSGASAWSERRAAQQYGPESTREYKNNVELYGEKNARAIKEAAYPTAPTPAEAPKPAATPNVRGAAPGGPKLRSSAATASEAAKAAKAAQAAEEAAKVAEAAKTGSKWSKAGAAATHIGAKSLGWLGVAGSTYSAGSNLSKGNYWRGGLDTISAITGLGAMTAGFTGIGIPLAAVLGGISMATGAASGIIDLVAGDDKPKEPKAKPTETPAGTKNTNAHATGGLDKLRWMDLSAEQQDALIDAQIRAEGYDPKANGGKGTRSFRNNNPGNMMYSPWTKQLGAIGADKDGFAIFNTYAEGRAAMKAHWERGKASGRGSYREMTIHDALQAWNGNTSGRAKTNYHGQVAAAIKDPSRAPTIAAKNADGSTAVASGGGSGSGSDTTPDLRSIVSGSFTSDQLKDLKDKDGVLKAFGDIATMLPEMLAGTFQAAAADSKKSAPAKPAAEPSTNSKIPVPQAIPTTTSQASEKVSLQMHSGGNALQPRLLVVT